MKKILLGLTTTYLSDWKKKIKETTKFNISEIALFLTCLDLEERKRAYEMLKNTPVKSVPHVHLRTDSKLWEIDYFIKNYHTKVFNIHSRRDVYPFTTDFSNYSSIIYVENTHVTPAIDELEKFAGLCVDFAHWEDNTLIKNSDYDDFGDKIKKYGIGCAHISSILPKPVPDPDPLLDKETYSSHMLGDYKNLDYIKKYLQYMSNIISIELENSFEEQLEIKKYLDKIINI
jgi:hypothetical protein